MDFIDTKKFGKRSTPEVREKAIELYNGGMEMREIAEIVGFNKTTVWAWVTQSGVKCRGKKKYSDELIEQIGHMYTTKNARTVARELGMSHAQVLSIIRNYGLCKSDKC